MGSFFLHAFLCLAMVGVALFIGPYLLSHWRKAEAESEAEATYLKRRAELKAEAEAADERLATLDKRVHLVSLGFREVARKIAPLVVNVANYREPRQGEDGFLSRKTVFQDPDTQHKYIQSGVGSGLLIKPGLVLTNHHVVKNAQRLRITFASGRSLGEDADAVVADPVTDLAIIRLQPQHPEKFKDDMNVTTVFADSDKDVQVGDWALAVGSPLGLRQTITQGVISAKGRLLTMLDLVELLQTDAAINPGNSGGPLFDQYGRVMGINVAIASDNGANQGIGFAIPSNTVKKIFEQLDAHGEVVRGYFGVLLDETSSKQSETLGLKDAGGVRITQVVPGEAADKAGLKVGDVIVAYQGHTLPAHLPMRLLRQWILETAPDTQATLEILRSGRREAFTVQVGKRPAQQ